MFIANNCKGGGNIKGEENSQDNSVSLNTRYIFLLCYALYFIVFGFIVDSPKEIMEGLMAIVQTPSVLMTDYVAVGGVGSAFVNAGLITFFAIGLLYYFKVDVSGVAYGSLFMLTSFSLFGKNIFNIWFIFFGVVLYSKIQKDHFSKHIYLALLGTSMAPVVSYIFFATEYSIVFRIVLGTSMGLLIGMVLPPVATYLLKVHQGFVLYNVGFSSGLLGTIALAILNVLNMDIENQVIWSEGNNTLLLMFVLVLSFGILLTGFLYNDKKIRNVKNIYAYSGKLITDYIKLEGFGATLINMGLNGFISILYVGLIGAEFNGPTVGGIVTVIGFSAFGKHTRNILPIYLGVLFAGFICAWDVNDPTIVIATLFGTSIAPIGGRYGWFYGAVAGVLTVSIATNMLVFHGGLSLYNVGFSTGIVAMFLVPVIEAFKKEEDYEAQQ
ncbi:uncharacterized protein DUF1576 [Natranaerovirga hydrolytica]|uniref:Uncharacterized protein DUF1576 n=1 Tax=Natranaerovirga hydrolytica TaxID=680378 RepID=A0A4R1MFJ1_9FIRM|nr:DUF1576 domain-containing protein [Natranaerovirga hydrolytica]TCK90502.1 uncharacterized protein DUF1576 [Natranaerovirga hydrolytica]